MKQRVEGELWTLLQIVTVGGPWHRLVVGDGSALGTVEAYAYGRFVKQALTESCVVSAEKATHVLFERGG